MAYVDSQSFQSAEQIQQFEADEQRALQEFIQEQNEVVAQVERVADAHKFKEAELKQQQKVLRAEIDTRAKELSFVARFCALAKERKSQVLDAERTLTMLQRQLQGLQQQQQQQQTE